MGRGVRQELGLSWHVLPASLPIGASGPSRPPLSGPTQ